MHLPHRLRPVECLFAGAGHSCEALSIAITSVRPLYLMTFLKLTFPHHLLSPKQNRPQDPKIPSSRLHHWLTSPPVPIRTGQSSQPLLGTGFFPCIHNDKGT